VFAQGVAADLLCALEVGDGRKDQVRDADRKDRDRDGNIDDMTVSWVP
jgi:hypothetical protein